MRLSGLALLALLAAPAAAAQTADSTAPPRRRVRLFGYPYVFYSPETEFALGVGGIGYFRAGADTALRPSKVLLSAYYTANQQYKVTLAHDLYADSNRTVAAADVSFGHFVDKFYGTGGAAPDTGNPAYILDLTSIELAFARRPSNAAPLRVGGVLRVEYQQNIDKQSNYFLVNGTVPGSEGGWITGVGATLTMDSRDNVFYPSRGVLWDARLVFYGTQIGGEFDFTELVTDLRWYKPFGEHHVVGAQAYVALARGDPPYFKLPKLGGSSRMRGWYEGRYRDRVYVMGQVEYRALVTRRFGFVAFAGLGDVGNRFSDFRESHTKLSGGLGLRYVLDPRERLNLRADFGVGRGTSGVYFAIEEAF